MGDTPNAARSYAALKHQLLALGFARPGSLVRRFMRCGKPGCHCMAEPPALHGPYHDWTYKVRGKTIAIRLTEAQAKACEAWVTNHRQLRRTVRKMEVLSLRETNRLLRTIS